MEYIDQQRAAFKDAYAKRFRKQLIMMVLLLAGITPLAFTDDGATFFGLSEAVLGPIALVATVAAVIFPSETGTARPATWALVAHSTPSMAASAA